MAYPKDALLSAVGGRVRLGCLLGLDGKVRDCAVQSEDPAGRGFGDAALGVASGFELSPAIRDGKPVADGRINIPVVFKPPPNLARPNWRRLPSTEDMEAVFPEEAQRQGRSGKAILDCLVGTNGALGACRLLSEDPPGLGFGSAALALTPSFLMSPMSVDGQPVDGGSVRIPILFTLSGGSQIVERRVHRLYRSLAWVRQPRRADVAAAYLAETGARPGGEDATLVLRCTLDSQGELYDCNIVNSTPSRRFAGTAERLSHLFRARLDPRTGPRRQDMVDITFHLRPGAPTDADLAALPPLKTVEMTLLRGPTETDLILPEAARKAALAKGWAEVECTVAEMGQLGDCAGVSEQAPGLDLGITAARAATRVQIATWNGLGDPTPGRRVRLKLEMKAEAGPPVPDKPR